MNSEIIAHAKKNEEGEFEAPHFLEEHLKNTARLAEAFAEKFNSGQWGYVAGLLHDIGKSKPGFQEYIRRVTGYDIEHFNFEGRIKRGEHSTSGAKLAEDYFGAKGRVLAYCIAGHHAGLPDWYPDEAGGQSSLNFRINNADIKGLMPEIVKGFEKKKLEIPWKFSRNNLDMALWIRMLFSCLVDADFLDTEEYMDPIKYGTRGHYLSIEQLTNKFNSFMEDKIENAEKTHINTIRLRVLEDCRKKAYEKPGIFSLTVPTGGGKTLSSLAFALEHAKFNRLDRIIYVIPYTSIIEQNAEVFRSVLGDDQVIEHHSSLAEDESTEKSRLSAENWDAPVIVTTTVQFFESLFSVKSSRCRKLHNIVNSVVILDETQLVPPEFLKPILNVIELLANNYNTTFVFTTATQPAFESRDNFSGVQKGRITEIISDVPMLYSGLKRVNVELPRDLQDACRWEDIATELKNYETVLCIVSDRKSCLELFSHMPAGTIHLSALMCGQHRSKTICEIKQKLDNDEPVRVISTQLVEAGVEFDFPVVYRALAGLDSIVQAAGRCNREGKLASGKVVVFVPPKRPPSGILRKAAEITELMIKSGLKDPLSHNIFEEYFSRLYWSVNNLDAADIIPLLTVKDDFAIQFRTAAGAFRIIDDTMQKPILVPYCEGKELIELLRRIGPERRLLRKLQRYSVNVYKDDLTAMLNRGSAVEIHPDIYALLNDVEYNEKTGLAVNKEFFEPEVFIT